MGACSGPPGGADTGGTGKVCVAAGDVPGVTGAVTETEGEGVGAAVGDGVAVGLVLAVGLVPAVGLVLAVGTVIVVVVPAAFACSVSRVDHEPMISQMVKTSHSAIQSAHIVTA